MEKLLVKKEINYGKKYINNSSENKNSGDLKEKVSEPNIEDNQPTGIY